MSETESKIRKATVHDVPDELPKTGPLSRPLPGLIQGPCPQKAPGPQRAKGENDA